MSTLSPEQIETLPLRTAAPGVPVVHEGVVYALHVPAQDLGLLADTLREVGQALNVLEKAGWEGIQFVTSMLTPELSVALWRSATNEEVLAYEAWAVQQQGRATEKPVEALMRAETEELRARVKLQRERMELQRAELEILQKKASVERELAKMRQRKSPPLETLSTQTPPAESSVEVGPVEDGAVETGAAEVSAVEGSEAKSDGEGELTAPARVE